MISLLALSAFAAEILYDAPLPADGETASTVTLWMEGLVPEDKLRVRASGGKVMSSTIEGPGLATVVLRPGEREGLDVLPLEVRVKGKAEERLSVPIAPPPGGRVEIAFEPERLETAGSVLVRLEPTVRHLPDADRHFALAASVGEVSEVSRAERGWSAVWTPPPAWSGPAAVLFAATDLTAPSVGGLATLPVAGRLERSFPAPTGAQVALSVGERELGEVTASSEGRAAFAFVAWPGEDTGSLRTVTLEDERSVATVDLENPAPAQLVFAPLPGVTLPAGRETALRLAASARDGAPRPGLSDLVAEIGPVRELGGGWYEVAVTPEPGQVEIDVVLGQDRARLVLQAGEGPSGLPPARLRAVLGEALEVTAEDAWGLGVPGVEIRHREAVATTDAEGRATFPLGPPPERPTMLRVQSGGLTAAAIHEP